MEITINIIEPVTIVAINGEIDANSAPQVQAKIAPLVQPGCRLLLDLTNVPYMSSAGLRILLATYRQVSNGGKVVLVGVAEEIHDTMSVTGFVKFFTIHKTVQEGIETLNA